jgi:hypothetical protein
LPDDTIELEKFMYYQVLGLLRDYSEHLLEDLTLEATDYETKKLVERDLSFCNMIITSFTQMGKVYEENDKANAD